MVKKNWFSIHYDSQSKTDILLIKQKKERITMSIGGRKYFCIRFCPRLNSFISWFFKADNTISSNWSAHNSSKQVSSRRLLVELDWLHSRIYKQHFSWNMCYTIHSIERELLLRCNQHVHPLHREAEARRSCTREPKTLFVINVNIYFRTNLCCVMSNPHHISCTQCSRGRERWKIENRVPRREQNSSCHIHFIMFPTAQNALL